MNSTKLKGMNKFIYDFKRYLPLLQNLVARDFKVKYRRSFLGIAWSVLNPLLTMLVLTSVFKVLLKLQIENFATFYIIGSTLWNFFSESTSSSMSSIVSAAPLIKKVYIPKYMFPLEKCLFSLVNFLFSMIAAVAVMLIQGVYPTWTTVLFPLPVIYVFIFSCGLSLILSALTVYFRDIVHLYGVLLTLWTYLTPIIYDDKFLSGHKLIETIVHLNPMYHYVTYFRNVVMYNTLPTLTDNLICISIAIGTLLLGTLIFNKAQKRFILHI